MTMPSGKTPVFSIIVPTLNRPDKIEACLRSLTRQSHSNYEIIVVDDGSTDSTPEIIESVTAEHPEIAITTLRNERTSGANPSRNRAISISQGRYIAFLDDDCIAHSDWLIQLESAFSDEKVAATNGLVIDQDPENIYELVFRGTHRLATPGPARRLIAGNMAIRGCILKKINLDTDRSQVIKNSDGTPDTSISGRGDEEGLFHRLRAYGYKIVNTPSARVMHIHHYSRKAFFRQAVKGGKSAAKVVYKFRLKQRVDMIFFVIGYGTIPLVIAYPRLLPMPVGFLALAIVAISYNDLALKGKSIRQFVQGFPVLLAYYHLRLWGYISESIKLRLGLVEIDRVDLKAESNQWRNT